jgi:hypothetical protein
MAIVNKDEPAPVIVASPNQTPDDPVVDGEVVEDSEDVIEDEFSLMVMKLLGVVILVFTIIEFGVGVAAYSALYNVKYGGWWIAFLSFPAGVGALLANKRIWVTATVVLAILAAILAFISTVIDGLAATTMHTFVTCDDNSYCANSNFDSRSYSYSDFRKISEICSCIPKSGKSCYTYYVSYPQGSVKSCNDLLTSFPMLLDASTVFSMLLLITTIGLSTVGIMILTCPAGFMGGEKKTEEVPDNNAVPPDNGLVGVNGNSDAV